MGLDYKLLTRTGAVHRETDHPVVPGKLNAPRALVELVPETVARENQIFPLSLDGETLTWAAVDPNNLLVRDKLSFILNKQVRFVPASREAIREAINRHYGRTETESMDSMLCEFTDTAIDCTEQPAGLGLYRGMSTGRVPGMAPRSADR